MQAQTWGDDSDAVLIRSGCLVDSLPGPFGYEHHLSNETFGAGSLEAWTEDAQAAPKEEAQAQLLLSCSAREAQKLRCSARNRGQGVVTPLLASRPLRGSYSRTACHEFSINRKELPLASHASQPSYMGKALVLAQSQDLRNGATSTEPSRLGSLPFVLDSHLKCENMSLLLNVKLYCRSTAFCAEWSPSKVGLPGLVHRPKRSNRPLFFASYSS